MMAESNMRGEMLRLQIDLDEECKARGEAESKLIVAEAGLAEANAKLAALEAEKVLLERLAATETASKEKVERTLLALANKPEHMMPDHKPSAYAVEIERGADGLMTSLTITPTGER